MNIFKNLQAAFIAVVGTAVVLWIPSCNASQKAEEDTSKPAVTSNVQNVSVKVSPFPSGDEVLAKVGKEKIYSNTVKDKFPGDMFEAETRCYKVKKRILDRFIGEFLLEKEAKRRGYTKEKLLQKEVESKVGRISKGEVEKFYNDLKLRNPRFASQPLESVEPRIRDFLRAKKMMEVKDKYIAKLRKKYGVVEYLSPPRLKVVYDKTDPVRGPKNAPIEFIEFSDYQCPFCRRAEKTVAEIWKKYRGKIKHVFIDFPLGFHKNAKKAAMAANCAAEQGKFWEYHDLLYKAPLGDDVYIDYAKKLGLNLDRFKECLDRNRYESDINKDIEKGKKVGVRGTPAFFINGRLVSGAQPLENFVKIIEEELRSKK